MALIDPSFLVKPNYFTTETSKQSTVGEKVYDLPLEREEGERSTSRIPSQSSFNEQNYPEYNVENIILQEDKMTTNKPLDGAFTDHIYPDYNLVDNSGHEELPGKHTTIRSKTDKTGIFEGEQISTHNPSPGELPHRNYPDYNQVDNSVYGQIPERHTTLRSITQSTSKYNNSYQEPELQPEEQSLQVYNINNIESLDPKYDQTQIKPLKADNDYDPVPAALNCPQANMCNQLRSILKKVGNFLKFKSLSFHFSVI